VDILLRSALASAIESTEGYEQVIREISLGVDGSGTVTYEPAGVWVDPSAPGFVGTTTEIGDEELVRAYLIVALATTYGYQPSPATLEVERVYKPVGRPTGKGGRIDVLVRRAPRSGGESSEAFLFIECKSPSDYDHDMKYIDGQLFRLSLQETPHPRYLMYYTVELREERLRERSLIVDTETFATFESWNDAGQPISDTVPKNYGIPTKRRYGNATKPNSQLDSLDKAVSPAMFSRLRTELHDVIWGGGGTNNNEVFVNITKLILAKIYDEHTTFPDDEYRFQRRGDVGAPESPADLVERMNELYSEAEKAYLALPKSSEGPGFDTTRVSAEKLAFVVGRLEGISVTENAHPGDLLGEFFEQIVSQDFTQTKGQFFTPITLVRFMLALSGAVHDAHQSMLKRRDSNGRPVLPYVIDPSCGVGTFLIEYMRQVTDTLGEGDVGKKLPPRLREYHEQWFGGSGARWAQSFLFGVENNYDLGLAAKVNMVLHGDGSMNTWIASGIAPFPSYWLDARNNVLGVTEPPGSSSQVYDGPLNEQFDLVLSNPPFSLTLPDDEKKQARETFCELPLTVSEALFAERWYQLLRPGGHFCCVMPESVLDTTTNSNIRRFLIERFAIRAVVSLPYDTFRPFTSTKTAIVLARKRSAQDVQRWQIAYKKAEKENPLAAEHEVVRMTLAVLGWDSERIFMAEPNFVGYKRRKNLPDLPRPNDLQSGDEGEASVLGAWKDETCPADSRFGFRTSLGAIAARPGMRLDPKYRWLWDFRGGHVLGDPEQAQPLSDLLEIVRLEKVTKGGLLKESVVIDLEHVESRHAFLAEKLPEVTEIGSDKVSFSGAELAFSKLEPYLGKLIIEPPQSALGSTEWIGLKRKGQDSLIVLAYLMLLPEMREAYRRLQSGKRHARLTPAELLDLKVAFRRSDAASIESVLTAKRNSILARRSEALGVRQEIDAAFASLIEPEAR
jgi:type I restriction enzyme M protein